METDKKIEDNVILIGKKGFMPYMRSIELLIRKKKQKKIILKARGKNITKCVDLAEAAKNKFLDDIDISTGEVKISTSKFNDDQGVERFVSCIDIELTVK